MIANGAVYIKGGNGGHHGIGASGKNLVLEGDGNLEVRGGDGKNGSSSGQNGGNGGIGIEANEVVVNITGDINIYGGNGGNGATGSSGGYEVSGGNGEQVLSRDVYRLGQLFDFFRMLSFYFTTVGYYFCTMVCQLCVIYFC